MIIRKRFVLLLSKYTRTRGRQIERLTQLFAIAYIIEPNYQTQPKTKKACSLILMRTQQVVRFTCLLFSSLCSLACWTSSRSDALSASSDVIRRWDW